MVDIASLSPVSSSTGAVVLLDASTLTRFRGTWAATTTYAVGDQMQITPAVANGYTPGLWRALVAHTSGATFPGISGGNWAQIASGDAAANTVGPSKPATLPLGPYTPADVVFPTVALSIANAVTALTGTTSTVYAAEVPATFTGDYNAATAYTTGQAVNYPAGSSVLFVALAGSTGVTPGTDATKWRPGTFDARFTSIGSPIAAAQNVPVGLSTFHNGIQSGFVNTSTQRSVVVAFGYTGSDMEILLPGLGQRYRLTVDGVVDPAGWRAAIPNTSSEYRVRLTFAAIDTHLIVVEAASSFFTGVTVKTTDALHKPAIVRQPRAIVQGDSVTAGQNIDTTRLDTFPYFLGRMLGWQIWEEGEGGTGFLNPGSLASYVKYADRLPRITPNTPDVLIAAGGLNDQTSANAAYTTTANQTAITTYVAAARAALPVALIVIVGPFFTTDQASDATGFASIKAVRDGQLAAMQALGCTQLSANASPIDVYANSATGLVYIDPINWLSGKFGVGGSANVLLSSDGIHPLASGHRYYARKIADGMLAALNTNRLL